MIRTAQEICSTFKPNFQLEAGETVKCTFYNLVPLDYGDAPDQLQDPSGQ